AAVVAHGSGPGERRLVGYVAPSAGEPEQLRRVLSAVLPAHMVPQVFVFLDALPRTGSGKVSRGHLPPPGRARPDLATPFARRGDEIEGFLPGGGGPWLTWGRSESTTTSSTWAVIRLPQCGWRPWSCRPPTSRCPWARCSRHPRWPRWL